MGLRFCVRPGGQLRGETGVPGDKSISHRALMLGAVANGTTRVSGFLESADTLATAAAFREMGVRIERHDDRLAIEGRGQTGLRAPDKPLDMGNSGTAMRLLAGLLAGQGVTAILVGDASLTRRPMGRIVEPLLAMGASIVADIGGYPPLRLDKGSRLTGIRYPLPMASAQVKSAVLLAGLGARGRTCVVEPRPTRDHTERMLQAFGCAVEVSDGHICVEGGQSLRACDLWVPGDLSSAAFFLVGASIAPGSDLLLTGVGINPTRAGVIEILRAMGGNVEVLNERRLGMEPVADLRVRAASLHGIRVEPSLVSLAIDEFPAIAVAAACAVGETIITGAEELRVKESDRIAAMATVLSVLGIEAESFPDGMRIVGGLPGGGVVDSLGDHRIAMAAAVAGLAATGPITIENCDNVATSFPEFARTAARIGLRLAARASR